MAFIKVFVLRYRGCISEINTNEVFVFAMGTKCKKLMHLGTCSWIEAMLIWVGKMNCDGLRNCHTIPGVVYLNHSILILILDSIPVSKP